VVKEPVWCQHGMGHVVMRKGTGHVVMQEGKGLVARPAEMELVASRVEKARAKGRAKEHAKLLLMGTVKDSYVSQPMGFVPFRVKHRPVLPPSGHATPPCPPCREIEPSTEHAIFRGRETAVEKEHANPSRRVIGVVIGHAICLVLAT